MKTLQPTCQIQFRRMPRLHAMQQTVLQHLERFKRYSRCEVVIDANGGEHAGGVYDISVRVNIPGEPLYAAHVTESCGSRDFLYGAVSAAFDGINRQRIKRRGRRYYREQRVVPAGVAA
jgi:hypothetical protein